MSPDTRRTLFDSNEIDSLPDTAVDHPNRLETQLCEYNPESCMQVLNPGISDTRCFGKCCICNIWVLLFT